MFQFLGYNFFGDENALDSAPSSVEGITSTIIKNGIFDHVYMTKNIELANKPNKPDKWDYDTIFNAPLDGDLDAGNIDFILEYLSAIKIKRRIKGEFNWLTLKTISITKAEDLTFVFNDFLNAYGVEYEYAFVPILNEVEGDYIINSILSKFNGVFIGDTEQAFKFLYNTQYGSNSRNQQVGVFTPLGKKYPVVISNGVLSYESGVVSGTILNDDFNETGKIDPLAITKKKNVIKDFLTNKKPKILKDCVGNIWLCMITSAPQVNYLSGSTLQIPQMQFGWTEIGDANSSKDLYINGVISEPN